MTPERMAAMEAAAAGEENAGIMRRVVDGVRLDESQSPVAGRRFTRAVSSVRVASATTGVEADS